MTVHTDLIDAVNEAKTQAERDIADAKLEGWRKGVEDCGRKWDFIEADVHSMARYGDRPICCGVLLDWKPEVQS